MMPIFKRTKIFLLLFALFVVTGIYLMLTYTKIDIYLFVNKHNSEFLDLLFKFITNLGHGLFAIVIVLALLFWRYRYSITVLVAYLSSGLISQVFKRFIFPTTLRPAALCDDACHFVEGIKLHYHHSFPSGHTTSAFAVFVCLAFFARNKSLQCLFFVLAIATGYSRIYLSQHFFIDVYFGALIGVIFAIFTILLLKNMRAEWLDRSILKKRKL